MRGLTKSLLGLTAIVQLILASLLHVSEQSALKPTVQFPNFVHRTEQTGRRLHYPTESGSQAIYQLQDVLQYHSWELSNKSWSEWRHWEWSPKFKNQQSGVLGWWWSQKLTTTFKSFCVELKARSHRHSDAHQMSIQSSLSCTFMWIHLKSDAHQKLMCIGGLEADSWVMQGYAYHEIFGLLIGLACVSHVISLFYVLLLLQCWGIKRLVFWWLRRVI